MSFGVRPGQAVAMCWMGLMVVSGSVCWHKGRGFSCRSFFDAYASCAGMAGNARRQVLTAAMSRLGRGRVAGFGAGRDDLFGIKMREAQ